MWEVAEKETLHDKVNLLWCIIDKGLGKNPFVIAANQGITVKYYELDSSAGSRDLYSQFRPEELAIHIFNASLNTFWANMFPGCSPELRYRYACWRELLQYWLHTQFAPLRWVLGDHWLEFIEKFSNLSSLQREYVGQYFASLATGVIALECDGSSRRTSTLEMS